MHTAADWAQTEIYAVDRGEYSGAANSTLAITVGCFWLLACGSSEGENDCSTNASVKWAAETSECKSAKVTHTPLGPHERFVVLFPGPNSQDQRLTIDTGVYMAGLLQPGSYANSGTAKGPFIQYSAPVEITSIPSASVTIESVDRASKTISGTFSVVIEAASNTGVQKFPITGLFKNVSF